jgi:hypothetical protein
VRAGPLGYPRVDGETTAFGFAGTEEPTFEDVRSLGFIVENFGTAPCHCNLHVLATRVLHSKWPPRQQT